jgi:hypothetical protein
MIIRHGLSKEKVVNFLKSPYFPLLIIMSGPPVWRWGYHRSTLSVIQGSYDGGTFLKLGAYGAAFALVLWAFFSMQRGRLVLDRMSASVVALFMIPLLLGLTFLYAPSAQVTLAFASMMSVGFACGVWASRYAARHPNGMDELFKMLFFINFAISLLVLIAYSIDPKAASVYSQGMLRIRGNNIGQMSLAGSIMLMYALHLGINKNRLVIGVALATYAMFCIKIAELRTDFVIAFMLAAYFVFAAHAYRPRRINVGFLAALRLVAAPAAILVVTFYSDQMISYLTRDSDVSLSTLSQRTLIWNWVKETVEQYPLGLGYISGFKVHFQNLPLVEIGSLRHQGLHVDRIGNTHGSFYEILIACGWAGTILIYAIFLKMLVTPIFKKLMNPAVIQLHPLYIPCLIIFSAQSIVQSDMVIPGGHAFGFTCFVVAMTLAQRRINQQHISNS